MIRAEMVLEQLEAPKLPAVDIEKSSDVADRAGHVYRKDA